MARGRGGAIVGGADRGGSGRGSPGLRCPECGGGFGPGPACVECGAAVDASRGFLDLLGEADREAGAAAVERFYDSRPFPGYAPNEDGASLLDRARRSAFVRALDRALAPDADVLEVGCGTAQLSATLALAAPRRRVLALDGCAGSLAEAGAFRDRVRLGSLTLARADLFALPVASYSYPNVVCRGVVHHTPEPYRAIAEVAQRVAPDGHLVLGWYESAARAFHGLRQGLHRVTGRPPASLDPVLRRRDLDPEKRRRWIDDQYRHPLEANLPLPRVVACLAGLGLELVRTIPPVPSSGSAYEPEPGPPALGRRRLAWAVAGLTDPDAGLVSLVARRVR